MVDQCFFQSLADKTFRFDKTLLLDKTLVFDKKIIFFFNAPPFGAIFSGRAARTRPRPRPRRGRAAAVAAAAAVPAAVYVLVDVFDGSLIPQCS